MNHSASKDVTALLGNWAQGDREALNRLLPLVYQELRSLAARYLRRERPGHTLQPTALLHEAYLRLRDQERVRWQNRAHFFAVAAQMMRRVLVDHARGKRAAKRSRSDLRVSLDPAALAPDERDFDIVALDKALAELEGIDPRQSLIVELRYFGGLTIEETAEVLDVSLRAVKDDWNLAKAWLYLHVSRP